MEKSQRGTRPCVLHICLPCNDISTWLLWKMAYYYHHYCNSSVFKVKKVFFPTTYLNIKPTDHKCSSKLWNETFDLLSVFLCLPSVHSPEVIWEPADVGSAGLLESHTAAQPCCCPAGMKEHVREQPRLSLRTSAFAHFSVCNLWHKYWAVFVAFLRFSRFPELLTKIQKPVDVDGGHDSSLASVASVKY